MILEKNKIYTLKNNPQVKVIFDSNQVSVAKDKSQTVCALVRIISTNEQVWVGLGMLQDTVKEENNLKSVA